jgi:hypothetical protein
MAQPQFQTWVQYPSLSYDLMSIHHDPGTVNIYGSNGDIDGYVPTTTINSDVISPIIFSSDLIPSTRTICTSPFYVYTASYGNTDISNGTITRTSKTGAQPLTYGPPPFSILPQSMAYDTGTDLIIMADSQLSFLYKISLPLNDASINDISYNQMQQGLNGTPTSLTLDVDGRWIYVLSNSGLINRLNIDTESDPKVVVDLSSFLGVTTWGDPAVMSTQGLWFKDGLLYFGFNNNGDYSIFRIRDDFDLSPDNWDVYPTATSVLSIAVDDYYNIFYSDDSSFLYKLVDPPCFNKGTKILCLNQTPIPVPPIAPIQQRCLPRNQLLSPAQRSMIQPPPQVKIEPRKMDEYIPIELLKVGDFVKTYKHGYRKISKIITGSFRNNPKKWNMCMYKMAKTDTNGLLEDLIVTGGHSLLVDSISEEEKTKYHARGLTEWSKETIDGKRLLLSSVSDQFTAMQDNKVYTYYHLLLENNDDEEERFGIWANGVLTETPNVKSVSK